MPVVPTYNTPQETERALPGVRQESIVSPGLLDAGAEQMGAFGKSVTDAGSAMSSIAYHMGQRENADVLFRHEADDKAAYLNYEADVRKNRQGQYAKGVTTDTATWWKDRISKNVEGMGNSEQKRLYSQRATALQLQSLQGMSNFEGQQIEVAHDTSWKADKINTINLTAANPTDATVATSMSEIRKFNSYQAARKGWDANVLQAENEADITQLHQQVIQTLVATNKDQAKAYFDAHKGEIAGSQRAEIGEFAEKATAAATGAKVAQAVWGSAGPKGDNESSNIDQMKATIREQLKDNTFARDAALQEISQMDADRDKGIRARDNNRSAQVNELLMSGKSLAAVQQTPAWLALDGTERRKILEHEESIAATRENRANAAEARAERKLNTEGLDTMIRLSDPTRLVAMSRDEIINLRTTIGNENTKSLLNKWDALTKSGTHLAEAKLDNDQFNTFAVRAGLNPQGKSDDDKRRIQDTRDKVERIIAGEQQNKKRPLTRDEKDNILQKQIDNQVIQHNSVFFDKSVPAITLPANKQADAYVEVGKAKQKVLLSQIPASFRLEATNARKTQGLPTSEAQLAELWLRNTGKMK